ncbi:MAG: Gfo/Idh/MocA family oxidoreductase [Planctomycetes bacterium]|nr:Gfo/Idh/MocA family oxidoreductase [Planctomycetota bacterium]
MYRVAILGCGMIAGKYEDPLSPATYSHGKAFSRHPRFSSPAFYDLDAGQAEVLAKKFSGRPYKDFTKLMNAEAPHCVCVCTPDETHADYLALLLSNYPATKLIFAEKPVVSSREEYERIAALDASSQTALVVHHNRRFDRRHGLIRNLIQKRELGEFIRGHVDYYGGFCHLGVHVVDVLQYFFNSRIRWEELSYCCESKVPKDPTLNARGRLEGCPFTMTGMDEINYQIVDINLLFSAGQIRIDNFGQDVRVFRKTINAEQERVLEFDETLSGAAMRDSIVSAVDIIAEYFDSSNPIIIEPFGLEQAYRTMATLWEGLEQYES